MDRTTMESNILGEVEQDGSLNSWIYPDSFKNNNLPDELRLRMDFLCSHTTNVVEFALKLQGGGGIEASLCEKILSLKQEDYVKLFFLYKEVILGGKMEQLFTALTFSGNDHIIQHMHNELTPQTSHLDTDKSTSVLEYQPVDKGSTSSSTVKNITTPERFDEELSMKPSRSSSSTPDDDEESSTSFVSKLKHRHVGQKTGHFKTKGNHVVSVAQTTSLMELVQAANSMKTDTRLVSETIKSEAQERARVLKASRDKIYNEVRQHFVANKLDPYFLRNSLRSHIVHLYMNTRLPHDLARVLYYLYAISERELQDCEAKNTTRDKNAFLYERLCESNSGEALAEGLYKTENYAILEFIHTNVVKSKQQARSAEAAAGCLAASCSLG